MPSRAWPLVVLVVAAALAWWLQGDDTAKPPLAAAAALAPAAAAATAHDAGPLEAGVAVRSEPNGGWWVQSLEEPADEPLAADPHDAFAPGLRGRLSVRQRPWVHPAGVVVRLTRSWLDTVLPTNVAAGSALAPASADPMATTDADGWFTLRCRPTRGELFFLIDRGGEWMDFQKVPDVPRPGQILDLGDVWLDDRGGITGTVVDGSGRALAGVTVRAVDNPLLSLGSGLDDLRAAQNRGLDLFRAEGSLAGGPLPDWVVRRDQFLPFPTASTDDNGVFRLTGLRPGAHDVYFAHAHGSTSLSCVQVQCGGATEVGIVPLRDHTTVRLVCVDAQDEPWVGAEIAFVHREFGFGGPALRTDARGAVEASVAQPERCRIAFAFPGGGPWITVPWPAGATLRVPQPSPIAVTLADHNGMLVRGGTVRFYVLGAAFRPIDRALPGAMQPREVEPGRHIGRVPCPVVAVASAPGLAPAMTGVANADVTMTMLPLQSITVRTIDGQGNTVAGAAVRIEAHDNPDLKFPGAQWTLLANDRVFVGRTDALGQLSVPVWNTFLSLQADHPEFGPTPGPKLLPSNGQRIDLQLRRKARLHGRLLIQQRPALPGFRVRAQQKPPPGHLLEDSGWLDEQLAVVGENGAFAFRGLDSGLWNLRPELPGAGSAGGERRPPSPWKHVQVLLDEGQELHCTIEAEPDPLSPPQIAGNVRMDGASLADVVVRLREREDHRARVRTGTGPDAGEDPAAPVVWAHRTRTDQFGDFAFRGLQPGREYEVRIDLPWQGRLQFLERRVVRPTGRRNEPLRIAIDLQSGTLHLHCTDGSRPFGNRMLRLRQIGKDGQELARFETLTSAQGICLADRLPAGTWLVEPVHGGVCEPAEFTIAPGASVAAVTVIRPW